MGEALTGYCIETPQGWIGWVESADGVRSTTFPRPTLDGVREELGGLALTEVGRDERACGRALAAFFAGERFDLTEVPVDLPRETDFQRRVRDVVRAIAPGRTMTYGEVAAAAGNPGAARAVGQIMARNPVAPLIPCHRVVGRQGLTGFGGGLSLKESLLAREATCAQS